MTSMLDLLRTAWMASETDLAVASLLMAGRLNVTQRNELAKQLEGDEVSAPRRLIQWVLQHGEVARRGPTEVYVMHHGDPDIQYICSIAAKVQDCPGLGAFFERSLTATNDARTQYRGEQAVLAAIKGATQ